MSKDERTTLDNLQRELGDLVEVKSTEVKVKDEKPTRPDDMR